MSEHHILKNTYYALRHGFSEKNELDLVVSYPEAKPYHLTEKGQEQVGNGAKWLKDKSIDYIFASDLTRTKESAGIVAKELGLEIVFDERLREMDMGVFNGKTHTEYHAFFNDHTDPYERFSRAPEGGESWKAVTIRMLGFLAYVETQFNDKHILLVSHGDPLWLLQWGSWCATLDVLKEVPYPETGKPVELDVRCAPQTHMYIE